MPLFSYGDPFYQAHFFLVYIYFRKYFNHYILHITNTINKIGVFKYTKLLSMYNLLMYENAWSRPFDSWSGLLFMSEFIFLHSKTIIFLWANVFRYFVHVFLDQTVYNIFISRRLLLKITEYQKHFLAKKQVTHPPLIVIRTLHKHDNICLILVQKVIYFYTREPTMLAKQSKLNCKISLSLKLTVYDMVYTFINLSIWKKYNHCLHRHFNKLSDEDLLDACQFNIWIYFFTFHLPWTFGRMYMLA